GKTNQQIARQLGLANATVGKWRRRFLERDVTGLHDELHPGRPRPISDERVARLVRKTLETKPQNGTHWSIRQIARQTRLSKSTVHRIWQAFGLQPHHQRHFKLSNDPFFAEKVRDIVRLYLHPPENAGDLCVDEKSQIQALERTQPILPKVPTYASWLNQVEIWFNRITQQAIRRGTFRSVKELVAKIDAFVQSSNASARPFVWTATADSIFAKVQRLCERISGTGH